jgi:cold shock CspA family protein
MQLTGILRSWNDDRGFGFIAPTHGGNELFVHISAFPRDGSRPVEGESLTYELGRGQNGKPQAVRVVRQAIGARAPRVNSPPRRSGRSGPFKTLLVLLVVVVGVAYAYSRFARSANSSVSVHPAAAVQTPQTTQSSFRCDGRTYCSQMTSCAEATYFLRHCPGVKMDGNNDGVPCEQQWCK